MADCGAATGTVFLIFVEAAPPVISNGGTSVFTLTSTGNVDAANGAPFTVDVVITLEGSFALNLHFCRTKAARPH